MNEKDDAAVKWSQVAERSLWVVRVPFMTSQLCNLLRIEPAKSNKLQRGIFRLSGEFTGWIPRVQFLKSFFINSKMSLPAFFCFFQGANFTCVSGWLRARGSIHALSDHQKALIIQTLHMSHSMTQRDVCSAPTADRYTSAGQSFSSTATQNIRENDPHWTLTATDKVIV